MPVSTDLPVSAWTCTSWNLDTSFNLGVPNQRSFPQNIKAFTRALAEVHSCRMLKKATVSPSQPWRAETRLVPGKAAGESKLEAYPLGYVEDFEEPRTTLGDFFSILLWFPP